jgi:uncharacterized protein YcbX
MTEQGTTATVDEAPVRAAAGTRSVAVIQTTPVKSLGLHRPEEIELTTKGVAGDRQFFLVDERGRIFVGRRFGPLVRIGAEWDGASLTLRFPDGAVVSGEVELGAPLATDFYGFRELPGHEVVGPWSAALSDYAGVPVRLIRADNCDAQDLTPASIVSTASIARLGRELGEELD